jgi:hypothetical protein
MFSKGSAATILTLKAQFSSSFSSHMFFVKTAFVTIVQTAKKMKVNLYQYIYDRITKKYDMPSLADMIIVASKFVSNTG